MEIFTSLLPLFLIMGSGVLAIIFKLLPANTDVYLNKYIVFIAVPALTISGLLQIDSAEFSLYPSFIVANLLGTISFATIVFIFFRKTTKSYPELGASYFTSVEGNTIYFGIPILTALMGAKYVPFIFIHIATIGQLLGVLSAFFLARSQKERPTLLSTGKEMLHNPIIIAMIVGLGLFLISKIFPLIFEPILPFFINSALQTIGTSTVTALDKIGSTTSILAMFSLGIYLATNYQFQHIHLSLVSSGFKLIIFPLIIYLFVYILFPLQPDIAKVSVILAAVPSAIYCVVASDVYKFDKSQTVNTIIISSILFLLIFPLLISLLNL